MTRHDSFGPDDSIDDLLERALTSRSAAARPGNGSLTDVHRRVRRRTQRRAAVGAGALVGVSALAVGTVIAQRDNRWLEADLGLSDGSDDPVGSTTPGMSTIPSVSTTILEPAYWRCEGEVAAPLDPTQPDVTQPGRWFTICEPAGEPTGAVASTTPGEPSPPVTYDPTCDPAACAPATRPFPGLSGIQVLVANGSGISGMAAQVSATLAARRCLDLRSP